MPGSEVQNIKRKRDDNMIFQPRRLGQTALMDDELKKDKKECVKFGPCGVGKKAVYLNSFYIDRMYYIPVSSVKRIFKRVAMSKGGFTGKGAFGTLPYLVVEYDDGIEKQCIFKHEEDVDRLLAYVTECFPHIPVHSAEAERKLLEKEKRLAEKHKVRALPKEAQDEIKILNNAQDYLNHNYNLYTNLSSSAKRKRVYERSNPSYKWVALAITIMGICSFVYGIYALVTAAGFGMYFLLFGLAGIFLFAGANVLPTSHNNRRYVEKSFEDAIKAMDSYIKKYPDFPVPAYYAHPVVLKRLKEIINEERADNIQTAMQVLKSDLKALNSDVVVDQEEYDEVIAIKPMFLVMDYR